MEVSWSSSGGDRLKSSHVKLPYSHIIEQKAPPSPVRRGLPGVWASLLTAAVPSPEATEISPTKASASCTTGPQAPRQRRRAHPHCSLGGWKKGTEADSDSWEVSVRAQAAGALLQAAALSAAT